MAHPALMPPTSPKHVSVEQEAVLGAIGSVTVQNMNTRFGGATMNIGPTWMDCMPSTRNPEQVDGVRSIANQALEAQGYKPIVSKAAVRRFIRFINHLERPSE